MKIEKKCMLWACCYEDFVYYYKKWRVIKCDYKGNIIKQKYQKILDFQLEEYFDFDMSSDKPYLLQSYCMHFGNVQKFYMTYQRQIFELDRFEVKVIADIPEFKKDRLMNKICVCQNQLFVTNQSQLYKVMFNSDYPNNPKIRFKLLYWNRQTVSLRVYSLLDTLVLRTADEGQLYTVSNAFKFIKHKKLYLLQKYFVKQQQISLPNFNLILNFLGCILGFDVFFKIIQFENCELVVKEANLDFVDPVIARDGWEVPDYIEVFQQNKQQFMQVQNNERLILSRKWREEATFTGRISDSIFSFERKICAKQARLHQLNQRNQQKNEKICQIYCEMKEIERKIRMI